jgi:hypothetical protein
LLDQPHCVCVSQRLLELSGTNDVREEQRDQTGALTTPKVFDFSLNSRSPILRHDAGLFSNPHARAWE